MLQSSDSIIELSLAERNAEVKKDQCQCDTMQLDSGTNNTLRNYQSWINISVKQFEQKHDRVQAGRFVCRTDYAALLIARDPDRGVTHFLSLHPRLRLCQLRLQCVMKQEKICPCQLSGGFLWRVRAVWTKTIHLSIHLSILTHIHRAVWWEGGRGCVKDVIVWKWLMSFVSVYASDDVTKMNDERLCVFNAFSE